MKRCIEDLAILGGKPAFDLCRPTVQAGASGIDLYLEEVRGIYQRRWLSNNGPRVRMLEKQLAQFHGTRHCIALANSSLGIVMVLQVLSGGRGGELILPALGPADLPGLARMAGLTPRFADVDTITHTLSPAALAGAISARTVAVLAVSRPHSHRDLDGIVGIAAERALPLVFHSSDALGNTHRGLPIGGFGQAEVFSLGATELLNGFEGGYVTTDNGDLADILRRQRDFNHPGEDPRFARNPPHVIGLNAKLNELHAAMALLSLKEISRSIDRNRTGFEAHCRNLQGIPGLEIVSYSDAARERRNFSKIILGVGAGWPLARDQTVSVLRAEGVDVHGYCRYRVISPGQASEPEPLEVADAIASRFIELPVGAASEDEIATLAGVLAFLSRHGTPLRGCIGA